MRYDHHPSSITHPEHPAFKKLWEGNHPRRDHDMPRLPKEAAAAAVESSRLTRVDLSSGPPMTPQLHPMYGAPQGR